MAPGVAAEATTMIAPASARILPEMRGAEQLRQNGRDHHVGAARCEADEAEEHERQKRSAEVARAMDAAAHAGEIEMAEAHGAETVDEAAGAHGNDHGDQREYA